MIRIVRSALVSIALIVAGPAIAQGSVERRVDFNIVAQPMAKALNDFATQAQVRIVFYPRTVQGLVAQQVAGTYTAQQALQILLANSHLEYRFTDARTVSVSSAAPSDQSSSALTIVPMRLARMEAAATQGADEEAALAQDPDTKGLPEIVVKGSKVLNMDIRRTRDDAQPYVIFDRAAIERSGAANVQDFLKNKLPMNTVGRSNAQTVAVLGNTTSVNLRGLGTNQTLILIDGHRTSNVNITGTPEQADLNGIPLAAIERIEVLPTTASGIYGGSATGGVINVVMRRDYIGAQTKLTYENSFDSDVAMRRIDANAGFSLEGGKTNILLAASYSDSNDLLVGERGLTERGRTAILANNPGFYLNAATPPVGATVNIRSTTVTGGVLQNLTLKNGGGALNSPRTSVPVGYAGFASDNGAGLLANAGRYNFDLANSAQSGGGAGAALLNAPTVETAMVTLRRQFTPNLDAFIDASASNNTGYFPITVAGLSFAIPASAATNPFNQAIQATVGSGASDSFIKVSNYDRRVVGGVIARLPAQWSAQADYTWDRARRDRVQPPGFVAGLGTDIANGAIGVVRDPVAYPLNIASYLDAPSRGTPNVSILRNGTLRVSGPLGSLPAGAPIVTTLLEHRKERFDDTYTFFNSTQSSFIPSRSQTVRSAYLEARLPLVSPRNSLPGLKELELQLAGRHDDYRVNGVTGSVTPGANTPIERATNKLNSTDYTFGLRYSPLSALMLRASYGTGFLPPSVTQVVPTPFSLNASTVLDPRRGNQPVPPQSFSGATGLFPVLTGGNAALMPEESKSWSAGFILTPPFASGLRVSVDYTRIEKKDNIASFSPQAMVDNEALFPQRVLRGPAPANDPYGVGPIVFVDATLLNISQAQVEAYDVQLDYEVQAASLGTFEFSTLATWQTHYKTQLLPTSPVVENVGVSSNNPLKFKANAGIVFRRGFWTLGWSTRYFDSYVVSTNAGVIQNQGSREVGNQAYHDVFGRYAPDFTVGDAAWAARLLSGVQIQFGINNVLDREPPFDASNTGHFYSYYGDPRGASYYLSLKKGF